jgi:hypothetical protein
MNAIKLNENQKIIMWGLIICLFIYSPLIIGDLRGYRPELRFLGDLHIGGFPSFILARNYALDFVTFGIDFVTSNGSTSFFLRPNFPSYYTPQFLLLNSLGHFEKLTSPLLFSLLIYINGVISLIFSALYSKNILKMGFWSSILCGALFTTFISQAYGQIAFFNVVAFFPAALYSIALAFEKRDGVTIKLLLSLPIICMITGGYLPIAVMGILVAYLTNIWILKKNIITSSPIILGNLYVGIILTAIYSICLVLAVRLVPALPDGPLFESMYYQDLSLTMKGLFNIFAPALPRGGGEAPHFMVGLPMVICYLIVFSHARHNSRHTAIAFTSVCLMIFAFAIVLSMGRFSGLANIFFYTVPALGKMHAYGRYMLIFSFFLALGLSYYINQIDSINITKATSFPVILISALLALCIFFSEFLDTKGINTIQLAIELVVCYIVILSFKLETTNKKIIALIITLTLHQASFTYVPTNWASNSNPGNTSIDLTVDKARMTRMVDFMLANSNKQLIKYIDLTPEVEKIGGVMHNFPWYITRATGDRRISSYMGYEQGLSMQYEYARMFSYYGKYDSAYLKSTGVDYLLYDEKTKAKEFQFISSIVDDSVPPYDVGNGFWLVKVNAEKLNITSSYLDNGLFKLSSVDQNSKASDFKTNWYSFAKIKTKSAQSSTLNINIFPHKFWKYYIDDIEVFPVLSDQHQASFTLPAGTHTFSMKYSFWPIKIFAVGYVVFLITLILLLLRKMHQSIVTMRKSGI